MEFMQAAALAAANSTVFRKMASPPRSRSKSPERQDQQQQHHHHHLERNNKIMLMNLRSPMASADWLHARHRPPLHDSLAADTTRGDLLSGHCADANTIAGADVGGAVAGEGCVDADAGGVADAGAAEDLRDNFA